MFKRSNVKIAETTDDLIGIRTADRVTQITSQSVISKSKGPTQTDKNNIWRMQITRKTTTIEPNIKRW